MDRRAVFQGLLLFAATVLTVWAGLLILSPFVVPIAWALCFLTVTLPLYRRLASRTSRPRLAALAVTLAVMLGLVVPVAFVGNAIVTEAIGVSRLAAEDHVEVAPKTGDRWDDFFAAHPKLDAIRARVDERLAALETDLKSLKNAALDQLAQPFARGAVGVLESLVRVLFGFLLMLVVLYFLLRDAGAIRTFVIDVVPLPEEETLRILETLRSTAYAALVGGLLTSMIQGTLGGVAFVVTGVGAPVLWGGVMAVASLLPFGGSAFVWGPVVVYFFVTGQAWQAWFLLLWGTLVIGGSDNVLRPWLMRRTGAGEIHPLLLFFGVLSGIGVFGFSGIVFGPLLVAGVLGVTRVYRDHFGRGATSRRAASGPS